MFSVSHTARNSITPVQRLIISSRYRSHCRRKPVDDVVFSETINRGLDGSLGSNGCLRIDTGRWLID